MKWKNYGLWVSIASLLYMTLKDLGFQIDLTQWQTYVTGILGILVTLGIISNPENGKGYFNAKVPPASNESTNGTNEANLIPNHPQNTQNQSASSAEQTDELIHDRQYTPYEK